MLENSSPHQIKPPVIVLEPTYNDIHAFYHRKQKLLRVRERVLYLSESPTMLSEWKMKTQFIIQSSGKEIDLGIWQLQGSESLFFRFHPHSGICSLITTWENPDQKSFEKLTDPVILNFNKLPFDISEGDLIEMQFCRKQRSLTAHLIVNRSFSLQINYREELQFHTSKKKKTNRFHLPGYPCLIHQGGQYQMDNFSFKGTMQKKPDLIILGDSGTEGYYAGNASDSYVELLRKSAVSDFVIQTHALAGATLSDALKSSAEWISGSPAFILIALGVNDIIYGLQKKQNGKTPAEALHIYKELVIKCLGFGIVPIICTPLPSNHKESSSLNRELRSFRDLLLTTFSKAPYSNYLIIDAYAELCLPGSHRVDPRFSCGDILHPGKLGHARIAAFISRRFSEYGLPFKPLEN